MSMKKHCENVAAKYTPAGLTIEYRKCLTGRAWTKKNKIATPRPVTYKSLYIYLHEIAHIILHTRLTGLRKYRYYREFEAEKQTHDWFEAEGIPVPQEQSVRARQYVARMIKTACKCGAQEIDPAALAFSELHPDKVKGMIEETRRRRSLPSTKLDCLCLM